MIEELATSRESLTRTRSVGVFERLSAYIGTLSPGDRLLAYVLGAGLAITALSSLYALQNHLLIEVPTYGGTLVEGALGSPRFVNPLLAISDADRDLVALTYAGLMGVSAEGSLTPVVAERYEISEDGKTYTFSLRTDAEFSDGTPITADDIVFTIEKAQDSSLKSPAFAAWSGVVASAPDAHTVIFTLAKPYAPFIENTTLGILPSHLWRNIPGEQFPFSTLALEPVGAGPFKPAKISRDSSGLITGYSLVANTRYPLGRPYLSGIEFKFFPREEDLSEALEKGAVLSAYGEPSKDAKTAPYARVFGVFFNANNNAVFARLEVRKALSLAIDRRAITEDILGGYATPVIGPVPPGAGIEETVVPTFEDSVAEAAAILRSGNWRYDAEARLWKHAAAKLSLDPVTIKTSNVPELKAVATAVKKDWEKLGVGVTIELYEPSDLNQNVIRPRKYDALLFGMVIGRDDDLYAFWDSQERNDPGLNIAMYANKTVDALLEEARATSDATKRRSNLQEVENLIAAEYPAAFTHAPAFVYTVPEGLRGVELPQITTPSDRFASVTKWHLATEAIWPFLIPEN